MQRNLLNDNLQKSLKNAVYHIGGDNGKNNGNLILAGQSATFNFKLPYSGRIREFQAEYDETKKKLTVSKLNINADQIVQETKLAFYARSRQFVPPVNAEAQNTDSIVITIKNDEAVDVAVDILLVFERLAEIA